MYSRFFTYLDIFRSLITLNTNSLSYKFAGYQPHMLNKNQYDGTITAEFILTENDCI